MLLRFAADTRTVDGKSLKLQGAPEKRPSPIGELYLTVSLPGGGRGRGPGGGEAHKSDEPGEESAPTAKKHKTGYIPTPSEASKAATPKRKLEASQGGPSKSKDLVAMSGGSFPVTLTGS
jgi:hypothetical protein